MTDELELVGLTVPELRRYQLLELLTPKAGPSSDTRITAPAESGASRGKSLNPPVEFRRTRQLLH
jgi:hypothetical protein